jgi:hypothetical protein
MATVHHITSGMGLRKISSHWIFVGQSVHYNTHFNKFKHQDGYRQGKLFIGRPCKKRADDLFKLGRHQLQTVAFLTRHAPVRGRLRITGLFNKNQSCRFCGMETETVQYIICCCKALSLQRYNVFGKLSVEPKEISTASVMDLCLFIRATGILNLC